METGYSNTTKTFTIIRTNGMMVSQTNLPLYNKKLKTVTPYINMRTLNIRCDAEIGQAAFLGCPELRDIHGEGVTSIGGMAFGCCPYLKYADFSKNLERIHQQAFLNCTRLETIKLSPKLQLIESGAFSGCSSLKRIYLPENAALQDDALPKWTEIIYY